MSDIVRQLEPKALWQHFADLNAVPRPSKQEERVIAFMKDFGTGLGLETRVDEVGNVIIFKPATPGKEDRPTLVLQSHLDMVHQKNSATEFDFLTEGIRMIREDDWVRADGTTLGADNGIGVAAIMALLASSDIPHPPLEALFTIDEETGMTGAMALQGGILKGKYLLNLDTEDDRELTIGCAGGIDVTVTGSYPTVSASAESLAFKIGISGLTGGHSGMDIHLGRGNANKLMNRLLYRANQKVGLKIASIDGGSLRNAIPRESFAEVVIPPKAEADFRNIIAGLSREFTSEYATTDPELKVSLDAIPTPSGLMGEDFQSDFLRAVYACPNGIYRMSPDIPGLVQTSNNLARVSVADGEYKVLCLTRSAVESEKMDLAESIRATFMLIGSKVALEGSYPGWTPKPGSPIVRLMSDIYRDMYQEEPDVNACHAGLECGILGQNYPRMEMISFGPNIRGAHSPDEKVQISSVQKFWQFLTTTLDKV